MIPDDMIPYDMMKQAAEQRNLRNDIKANTFNPLKDIPTNDEQAEIAIKFGKDPLVGASAYGLYQIYRKYDDATIIQAYERALIEIINASGYKKLTPIS